jgi:hypothetical protein
LRTKSTHSAHVIYDIRDRTDGAGDQRPERSD